MAMVRIPPLEHLGIAISLALLLKTTIKTADQPLPLMDKILLLSLQKEFPPREYVLTPVCSPLYRYLGCTAVRSKNSPPVPARDSNKHCKFQLPTGMEDKAPFRVY